MYISQKIDISAFLEEKKHFPLVDVRSPREFNKAHIPGAINISLFSNEERAIVGTLYKKKGKELSILKGLEIAGPKLANFVQQAINLIPGKTLFIHCWRGGMRSESMAWLFQTAGFQCKILEGGYRAYRQYIKQELDQPRKYIILGGMTGSGKTEILKNLAQLGEQMIDLEGFANHKGSAFGGIGQEEQPSTEQFENNIYEAFRNLDSARPIWLEDESKSIGQVQIPDELFLKMRTASVIEIVTGFDQRVERLNKEYARLDTEDLKAAISRIRKRLGEENVSLCFQAIEHGSFKSAIKIVLRYYDKTYSRGLAKREPGSILKINNEQQDLEKFTLELIRVARSKFETEV